MPDPLSPQSRPEVGDVFPRGIEPGTEWRVYAIGQRTGDIYMRLEVDGKPTAANICLPASRMAAFLVREGADIAGSEAKR